MDESSKNLLTVVLIILCILLLITLIWNTSNTKRLICCNDLIVKSDTAGKF